VKTWIKSILAGLFVLMLLFIGGVFFLLTTQAGARIFISKVEKLFDDQLRVGTVKGRLLDRLELTDVKFANSSATAELGHLILDWKSTDLLRLHLHILELTAADILVTILPGTPKPETDDLTPVILPELALPLSITLEKLGIDDLAFYSSPDAQPLTVNSGALTMLWNKSTIQLQKLNMTMPAGRLQAHGHLTPVADYQLRLKTEVDISGKNLPSLKLIGNYSGDLKELVITQSVSDEISAQFDVTVKEVVNGMSWQGNLQIQELHPAALSPGVPGVLKGDIQTRGDLQQAVITGSLSIRDAEAAAVNWDADLDVQLNLEKMVMTVNHLLIEHPHAATEMELNGTIDSDEHLDLSLTWKELQWPINGKPEYVSSGGTVLLKGQVDDYKLTLKTDVAGSQLPAGTWQLLAEGNSKGAEIKRLNGKTMEGAIGLQGDIQWTPRVTWNLTTDGSNINPAIIDAAWPGRLSWLIKTDGVFAEKGIEANVSLAHMEGTLRGIPMGGNGEIRILPDHIDINALELSSGKTLFSASGGLGDASTINWKIDVADFSDLLPDSSGTMNGQGTIKGEMRQPQVTVQLSADSLVVNQLDLKRLRVDADFDLSWVKPFYLQVTGSGLKSGDTLIKELNVQGAGSLENHTVKFAANHDMANVEMGLKGGYQHNKWLGLLDTLTLDGLDFGVWQLVEPAKITAEATNATMEKMCLGRETADLCINGSWNKENNHAKGDAQLRQFPLAWLSPWFPDTLQSLDGLFSVKGSVDMQDTLQMQVAAEITPGSLGYTTDTREGSVSHQGGKVNIHIADGALDTDFLFAIDSNAIRGHLKSPDLMQTPVPRQAKLTGELFIDAKKFDVVEALVPDVRDLDAVIDIHFNIDGSLDQPDIQGAGKLILTHVLVPMAGLELEDTALDIKADNQELKLTGTFNSGDGSLDLDGEVVLDGSQNWPLALTLKSDNFKLINLPEAQVYLTSDVILRKNRGLLNLTGEVTVPKAYVFLRDLPEGTETVSPDVVIIQTKEEEEHISPLQLELKVTLGKDVHFAGMGLNAFIDGQLTMTAEPEEQILGSGVFQIKEGTYRAYSQNLDIETGVISFPGGPLSKPGINLRATRTIGRNIVGINGIGSIEKPRLTTFSNPPMSESKVLSYLLTGSALSDVGQGAKLSIGRRVNDKLSVSVGTDIKTGEQEFAARYRLNRKTHIQTTTATNSNAVDIFYTLELGGDDE